ncbi:thiamine phosphate synthase [bacterium]|nr:thiamine phosphate synthase [bacterium]
MFPHRLYLITDERVLGRRPLIETVEAAVRGGVDLVQYRNKTKPIEEQADEAGRLKERLDRMNVPLIINDHSKVAYLTGSAGLHLGQEDALISEARRFLPTQWIGLSTHTPEQARRAAAAGAAYIGFGPIFHARTKSAGPGNPKSWPPVGCALLRTVLLANPALPIFPIGGIDETTVDEVLKAGATRLAVCGAILGARDPEAAARAFRTRLDKKLDGRYGAGP